MMAYLGQTAERLWMGIYLRFLALVMAYGALVHESWYKLFQKAPK